MDGDNVIRAFSAEHVVRLTGLSRAQLRNWDSAGFFAPEYAFENRRSPASRLYSMRDVIGLRTLSKLRKDHQVSLQHLKQVAQKLSNMSTRLWSSTKLYVFRKRVYFYDPVAGGVVHAVTGQYVMVPLITIINDVKGAVNKLKTRTSAEIGHITARRNVASNRPVIAGTRIPVDAILSFSRAGYSTAAIIKEYPDLKPADIKAALEHREAS